MYEKRQSSVSIIEAVNILINSIANSPKEFESKLTRIEQEKEEFRKTEEYAAKAYDAAIKSGAGVAAGVAGGAAIASLAPSVAMWVATTFGTTSTGVAISTLYGAAATNAALAWLGGGALAAGGAGMAGGHAFLALAGPIGWGIAGASATASIRWLIDDRKPWKEDTMRSVLRMRDELLARGMDETRLKFHVIPDEKHSPATWRETFPEALRWIFRNSF